jgi:hypothetical protein
MLDQAISIKDLFARNAETPQQASRRRWSERYNRMLAAAREPHVEPELLDPKPDIIGMLVADDATRDAIRVQLAAQHPENVELMASRKVLMRADLSREARRKIRAQFELLKSRPIIPKRRIVDVDNGGGGVGLA